MTKHTLQEFNNTQINEKPATEFHIWEGIFPNFELAEREKVEDGFSSHRYITQANTVAIESLTALSENRSIPFFHKQRFT